MPKTKPRYPNFWAIVDTEGVYDTFSSLPSLFAKSVNYTSEAVVLEIDPNEERVRNRSEDLAHLWLEQASLDDDLPTMFEFWVSDWWEAMQERRDDPNAEASKADQWHDLVRQ